MVAPESRNIRGREARTRPVASDRHGKETHLNHGRSLRAGQTQDAHCIHH